MRRRAGPAEAGPAWPSRPAMAGERRPYILIGTLPLSMLSPPWSVASVLSQKFAYKVFRMRAVFSQPRQGSRKAG
jgi:hypothetical protein